MGSLSDRVVHLFFLVQRVKLVLRCSIYCIHISIVYTYVIIMILSWVHLDLIGIYMIRSCWYLHDEPSLVDSCMAP